MNCNKSGKQVKAGIVLAVILLILILDYVGYSYYIYVENHRERTYSFSQEDKNTSFVIEPRGLATDTWIKELVIDDEEISYKAEIYNITMKNIGDYDIDDWRIRVDIQGKCFINNGWCGVFEIHQKAGDGEVVQTIDLRNYDINELKLKYLMNVTDLLIILDKGDYFYYYPNADVYECPIMTVSENKDMSEVNAGMIIYYLEEEGVEFTQGKVIYSIHMKLRQLPVYKGIVMGFALWLVAFIAYISVVISNIYNQKRFKQDQLIISQAISVFTNIFDAKDTYTTGHSQRVAEYTRLLCEQLGFSENESVHMAYIAMMHDCGKFYVPDEILKKPGKLTVEEFDVIKQHPKKGADMLENFSAIKGIQEGALYHHERYDGNGYPTGKKGEEIPMVGRIICVADSFDAMNSKRCYREQLDREYILSELENNKGKQFDPKVAEAMIKLIKDGKIKTAEL